MAINVGMTSSKTGGGRTRLAPTPSGFLHVGNAFNFLLTTKLAEATRSTVVLRIDDLDTERCRSAYVDDIFRSLDWLGITVHEGPSGPDDLARNWSQTLRMDRYAVLAARLKEQGVLYPCDCSRAKLGSSEALREVHTCPFRPITSPAEAMAWRLRIPEEAPVELREMVSGSRTLDLAALMDDPVLVQRDGGRPAYQLASLSDDLDMAITFIVRGVDLLPSSAFQSHIAGLLGAARFAEVRFHHHPLSVGPDGAKLSKSAGASSLKALRSMGKDASDLHRAVDLYLRSEFGFSI